MRRVSQAVSITECRLRALHYLASLDRRVLTPANPVGNCIWPDTAWTSQGMGGAASRILRGLQKDGLVDWVVDGERWGYRITQAGRGSLAHLQEGGTT